MRILKIEPGKAPYMKTPPIVLLGGVVLGFPQYLDFYCVSDILLLLLYCIVVSLGGVLWIIML